MRIRLLAIVILANALSMAKATNYYLAGTAAGDGTGIGGWNNAASAQTFFVSLQGTVLQASTHIYIKSCNFSYVGLPTTIVYPLYLSNNDILIQGGFPSTASSTDISGYNPVANPVSIDFFNPIATVPIVFLKSNGTGVASNLIEVKGLTFGNNLQGATIFGGGSSDGGTYRFTDLQVNGSTSPNGFFLLGGFTKGGSATFQNCEFYSSYSNKGGASIINGGADIPFSVINCSFNGCASTSTVSLIGNGAISTSYPGTITISGSGFCNNADASTVNVMGGGAICCFGSNYVTLNISGCTFKNNSTSGGGGGAIYCNTGTVNVSKCLFMGNGTNGSTMGGGAIFLVHSNGGNSIDNCTFYNNQCPSNTTVGSGTGDGTGGGAINIGYDNVDFTITNSEFVSNSVGIGSSGGAIILYNDEGTKTKIKNCLFRGNNLGNTTIGNNTTVGSDIIAHASGGSSGILTVDTDSLQLSGQSSYKDFAGVSSAGYSFQGSSVFSNSIDHVGSPSFTCPTYSQTIVLPIDITDFTAIKVNNGNRLVWTAENAVNFSHFIVQRKNESGDFAMIGVVDFGSAYNFTDENPMAGINYYRLEMVDKDGSVQYSPIVMVVNSNPDSFVISLYPTPSKDIVNISFNTSTNGRIIFNIFDLNGKNIMRTEIVANSGSNKRQLYIGNLPSGVYFARGQLNYGEIFTFKIIKQ